MVDSEVENILSEIRERVLAEQRAAEASSASNLARPTIGNGGDPAVSRAKGSETAAAETLALIDSYLTTTARAWDRLPPVVSNRTGTLARLELWLKRRLRGGTRWFTWEQVNFNAAVHHALREMLQALSSREQALAKLRSETETRQKEVEHQTETNAARLSELVTELRERDAHLQDEQRVCFKQLSLEATEAAVLEDRARRKTEALLEELKRRIEQLEKKS
jgi:hypothetical protein